MDGFDMARVEIRPSGGHPYAVVVDDVATGRGGWRKRGSRCLGNAGNAANVEQAELFALAINAGKSVLAAEWFAMSDVEKVVTTIAEAGLAAAVLAWLLEQE